MTGAGRMTDDNDSPLTPRERELALLLTEGLSNAEIAQRTGLTTGTVSNHLSRIMAKLGVHSRLHVAIWVLRNFPRSGEK